MVVLRCAHQEDATGNRSERLTSRLSRSRQSIVTSDPQADKREGPLLRQPDTQRDSQRDTPAALGLNGTANGIPNGTAARPSDRRWSHGTPQSGLGELTRSARSTGRWNVPPTAREGDLLRPADSSNRTPEGEPANVRAPDLLLATEPEGPVRRPGIRVAARGARAATGMPNRLPGGKPVSVCAPDLLMATGPEGPFTGPASGSRRGASGRPAGCPTGCPVRLSRGRVECSEW